MSVDFDYWVTKSGRGAGSMPAQRSLFAGVWHTYSKNFETRKDVVEKYVKSCEKQLRLEWRKLEVSEKEPTNLKGKTQKAPGSLLEQFGPKFVALLLNTFLVAAIRLFYDTTNRISRPPGSTLFALADFLCSKRTVEEIVVPLIADMQFEYNEALLGERKYKAMWVRVRGGWSFFKALGMYSIVRTFIEIWRKVSSV